MRIPLPLLLLLLLVVSDAIFAPVAYLHTELQPGARFSTFISSRGDQLFVPAESSCTHIAARACRSWAAWNIIVVAHFAKVQVIISSVCCWFLDETRVLLERTKRGEISTNSTEMSSWSKSFCIGFSDASNLRFLHWTFILVVVVSHGLLCPRLWLLAFSNITNSKRKTRMAFMRRLLFAFHNNVLLFCWFSFQLSMAVVMTDFGNCRRYAIVVSSMLLSLCSCEDWVLCHMLFESSGVAASSQLMFWYIWSVVLCLSLSF